MVCGLSTYFIPWIRVFLEKPIAARLLTDFPTFYGIHMFITVFTRARQWQISWARRIQSIPPHPNLSKIHPNIILLITSTSPYWSLSFWLSQRNPICMSLLYHVCYMPIPSWNLSLFGEEYKLTIMQLFFIWFVRLLALRPLLAYCASLGW
jgi:hypothetical protein